MRVTDVPKLPFRWPDVDQWHEHDWDSDHLYLMLVESMAKKVFPVGVPFYYQAEPNLRVQAPGEKAVPWHTDADFGHLHATWNVWIPLTQTTDDSQRLWLKNEDGHEWAPEVPLGFCLIFPGSTIEHGNRVNATDEPRMSFDFRLIRKRDYRDRGLSTVLHHVPLRLGDYWRES